MNPHPSLKLTVTFNSDTQLEESDGCEVQDTMNLPAFVVTHEHA